MISVVNAQADERIHMLTDTYAPDIDIFPPFNQQILRGSEAQFSLSAVKRLIIMHMSSVSFSDLYQALSQHTSHVYFKRRQIS